MYAYIHTLRGCVCFVQNPGEFYGYHLNLLVLFEWLLDVDFTFVDTVSLTFPFHHDQHSKIQTLWSGRQKNDDMHITFVHWPSFIANSNHFTFCGSGMKPPKRTTCHPIKSWSKKPAQTTCLDPGMNSSLSRWKVAGCKTWWCIMLMNKHRHHHVVGDWAQKILKVFVKPIWW